MSRGIRLAAVTCFHRPGGRLTAALRQLDTLAGTVDELQIVLDGVSPDEHDAVTAWAAGRPTVAVHAVQGPNGVAAARNLALRHVSSDYVWFVDDDDEWEAHAPGVIREALAERPDVLLFRARYRYGGGGQWRLADGLDRRGEVPGDEARGLLLRGELHGFLWSKVFATAMLGRDPFPSLTSQSDVVGVARAFARASTFTAIPDVLYTYVRRPGSITRTSGQRLVNLGEACRLVVVALEPTDQEGEAFTAWFLCEGVVRTAARQRMRFADARPGLAAAREAARRVPLRAARRSSLSAVVTVALLRLSPALTVSVTRLAYRALDTRRRLWAGAAS